MLWWSHFQIATLKDYRDHRQGLKKESQFSKSGTLSRLGVNFGTLFALSIAGEVLMESPLEVKIRGAFRVNSD